MTGLLVVGVAVAMRGAQATESGMPVSVKTARPDSVETTGPDSVETAGPDSVKSGGPDSVKRSGPVLVKTAGPDSVKAAGPDSVKAAEPDSVKSAEPDSVKSGGANPVDSTARLLPFDLRLKQELASRGRDRGQVIEPAGVVVDDFGRIFLSDASLHRIQRFDKSGEWLDEAGSLGSDAGRLRRPGSLALLGTLNVAVLDRENRRVQSYDLFARLQGTLIDLLDDQLDRELGRIDPVSMASDRGGAVYIVEVDRDRLLVFDSSGRFIRTLGGYGARLGSFRGLRGVASGPNGELITAEREGARIQRLDPGGRSLGSWALDVEAGDGALPVAADDSTRIAVADQVSGTLWVFDTSGRLLAMLEGFDAPSALAFAPDGTLLVADGGAGWVRRYQLGPREDLAPSSQE